MATPKRRIHYPSLGKYFEGLRVQRGWNQSQAADIAKRRKLPLSYQALRGLEDGQTKHPTPAALKALGALYDVPYPEVVAAVIRDAYDVEFSVSGGTALSLEENDEAASEDFTPVRILSDKIAAGPPLTINVSGYRVHGFDAQHLPVRIHLYTHRGWKIIGADVEGLDESVHYASPEEALAALQSAVGE